MCEGRGWNYEKPAKSVLGFSTHTLRLPPGILGIVWPGPRKIDIERVGDKVIISYDQEKMIIIRE